MSGICTLSEPALSLGKVRIYICRQFTAVWIHSRKRNIWKWASLRAKTRVERQPVTSQAVFTDMETFPYDGNGTFCTFLDARHIMQLRNSFTRETISESRFPDPMLNQRISHST